LIKFTLDTNCPIALHEGRPDARFVRALVDAHIAGKAHVAIGAIAASEHQADGNPLLQDFEVFAARLDALGLGTLDVLPGLFYFDISFFDQALMAEDDNDPMVLLERQIHQILFPNVEFEWPRYASARGISVNDIEAMGAWRNKKCDVQALWSHIYHRRDVFVTSDKNFHALTKKPLLVALGAGRIETPEGAVALL